LRGFFRMTQKVLWIVTIFFISVLTLMFVSKTALASEIFEPVSGLQVTNDIVVLAKPGQDLTPGEHLGYQLISSTALLAPQNIQKIAIAILEKEMPDGVRRKSMIRTPD